MFDFYQFFYFFLFSLQFFPLKASLATGYFLNEEGDKQNAKCLDGSSPLYYHAPSKNESTATKWFIYFQEGGWCVSLEDCYGRSRTSLGSTLRDRTNKFLENDYFSDDAAANPLLYNWNKVYIRYCDGGSFSGNSSVIYKDKELHFRGFNILNVIFEDLIKNRGMDIATDVVISGCSAGGLTAILHVDYLKKNFFADAKVVALPDSGFFIDFIGTNGINYQKDMKWTFENMKCEVGVNQKCVEFYPLEEKWKCFFAEYTMPFIESPLFILQSIYDIWQIYNVMGDNSQVKSNFFGNETLKRLQDSVFRSEINSGFIDSCFHHCGFWSRTHIENLTPAQSFLNWYTNLESKPRIQVKEYPCYECCY